MTDFKGPIGHAKPRAPITLQLKSNLSPQKRGIQQIGPIGDVATTRVIIPLTHAVISGFLARRRITGVENPGGNATTMTIIILATGVHEYLVTITGTTDGTYEILINGNVAGTFAASSNSIEQIRNGLILSLNAGNDPATGDPLDTDKIVVRDPGRPGDEDRKNGPDKITGTKENTGFLATQTGPDITIAEQDGFADGEDVIIPSEALTITSGNFPRDLILEETIDPVKRFSVRGSDDSAQINPQGVFQAVISLNGASNAFKFNMQYWGEEYLS